MCALFSPELLQAGAVKRLICIYNQLYILNLLLTMVLSPRAGTVKWQR